MNLTKMLGIITVIIIVSFSMMLGTSYAWYAFDNASTTFSGVTNNDDIIISYQKGEYINTNVAIPISSSQIAQYSDKNNFNIRVKENIEGNEIAVSVSLVDISISGALQDKNFKVDLLYQGNNIASFAGNTIGVSGQTTLTLGTVVLDDNIDNLFEARVYLLDDGTDQTALMNKTFQAKLQVDVVSRLKTSKTDYNDADIYVSSITIDGETSNSLPTSGYYDMSSTCTKGSNLTWEPLSKTITYTTGSYINDSCSLAFTSSTDYPLLSEMPVGSYVKYVGSNGCEGKACEGYNANYVNDIDMGYCSTIQQKFYVNGWRIAYMDDNGDENVSNNNAIIVSAGAPECVKTYVDGESSSISTTDLSKDYFYGSGYIFDDLTGKFTLIGVTDSVLVWNNSYENIIANTPYTCKSTSSTGTCTTLYNIDSYNDETKANVYVHNNYEMTHELPVHIAHLNSEALKYCNRNYAYEGVCNSNTAWAMNVDDFEKITGMNISDCYSYSSDGNGKKFACGWKNDLIDNGGLYWYATYYGIRNFNLLKNNGKTGMVSDYASTSNYSVGLRPVLKLDSTIIVISGSGTYEDPYVIDIKNKVIN